MNPDQLRVPAIYVRIIDIRMRMSETKLDTQHAQEMILEEAVNQMQKDFGPEVELYSIAPTAQAFVYLSTWQWFPPAPEEKDAPVNEESEWKDPLQDNPLLAKVTNRLLDMPICAKKGCGEREAHPAHFYLDRPYVQLFNGDVVETHEFLVEGRAHPSRRRPFGASYRSLMVPADAFGDDE